MKGVQCYELFGGIALKNYAFLCFSNVNMTLRLDWIRPAMAFYPARRYYRYLNLFAKTYGARDVHTPFNYMNHVELTKIFMVMTIVDRIQNFVCEHFICYLRRLEFTIFTTARKRQVILNELLQRICQNLRDKHFWKGKTLYFHYV